jgi:anaerobic magnesium-protoporphyrin IX monomethyl ester cyclase
MRVLLIGQEYEENLSIRYLSSSLRDAGHDVVLSPFNCADDIDSVVCDAFDADLVGLSMCFQVRVPEFLKLARRIKEEYPSRLILAGGHYASCAAEDLLRNHPEIDLIVIHEGEKTIVEIADAGANLHSRLHDIEGIAFRDGSGIHFTTPRHNISDLDLLPFPDRNGPVHMLANVPTAYVLGSRGCLNSCDYCCISTLYKLAPGKKFRQRSIENITDEMAELYHNLGIRQFVFEDDNFLVPSVEMNLKRITALENALHSRGVGEIAFAIKCRPAEVDPVVFVKM